MLPQASGFDVPDTALPQFAGQMVGGEVSHSIPPPQLPAAGL
jgi:hypothetical protein